MRTKKVFGSHAEVAHIWAQQKQNEGRASNVFFEGVSIFSYGHHFEIARFVTPEIVLFNSDRYSPSTGKHQNHVYRAINHKTVFTVPSMSDHNGNVRYYIDQVKSEIDTLKRGRTSIQYRNAHIGELIATAGAYVKAFKAGVNQKLKLEVKGLPKLRAKELPKKLIDAKLAKEIEWDKRAGERQKARAEKWTEENRIRQERYKAEEAERKIRAAEDFEKWKNGEDVSTHYLWNGFPLALRLNADRTRVETSWGAQITVKTALKLWERLTTAQNVAGMELDSYTVDGFEADIVTVGCHQIPVAEIKRIAAQLNLDGVGAL